MSRRIFGPIFGGLLITGAVAVVIAPREYWQNASWVPYREYAGEFSGRPVVMTPPSIGRPTVPLALAGPASVPFRAGIDTHPHLIASAPVLQ